MRDKHLPDMKNRDNALREVRDLLQQVGYQSDDPDDMSQYSSGLELVTRWMIKHWTDGLYLQRDVDGQPDTPFIKLTERRHVGTYPYKTSSILSAIARLRYKSRRNNGGTRMNDCLVQMLREPVCFNALSESKKYPTACVC